MSCHTGIAKVSISAKAGVRSGEQPLAAHWAIGFIRVVHSHGCVAKLVHGSPSETMPCRAPLIYLLLLSVNQLDLLAVQQSSHE